VVGFSPSILSRIQGGNSSATTIMAAEKVT
jgi:hypothetical protein